MKNLFFGLIATVLFSVTGFANTQIVNKQKSIDTEKSTDKFNKSYNLGNISNFTDLEFNTMINSLTKDFQNYNEVDECTISLTAEVNVLFGSVSVTVSYTAANCELAMQRAGAALKGAVKQVKELAAAM